MITKFKLFENSVTIWNNFINKVNKGIIPKDSPDVNNIEKLKKLIPTGKVLDLSVGDGAQSEYFIENGYDVYGTDISDLAIKTIKDKYPKYTWIAHDTENKFPFTNNMFNIVFARLALHYFSKESIANILSDIYRIIKPSGVLFVMVKISNTGEKDTSKKSYTQQEWGELISENFTIIDEIFEVKRAYSFETTPSNILQFFAKKHNQK